MISAFVKEILPFKAFKFLAIHADTFNVICGLKLGMTPKNYKFSEMYQIIYQIKAYDKTKTTVKPHNDKCFH